MTHELETSQRALLQSADIVQEQFFHLRVTSQSLREVLSPKYDLDPPHILLLVQIKKSGHVTESFTYLQPMHKAG